MNESNKDMRFPRTALYSIYFHLQQNAKHFKTNVMEIEIDWVKLSIHLSVNLSSVTKTKPCKSSMTRNWQKLFLTLLFDNVVHLNETIEEIVLIHYMYNMYAYMIKNLKQNMLFIDCIYPFMEDGVCKT